MQFAKWWNKPARRRPSRLRRTTESSDFGCSNLLRFLITFEFFLLRTTRSAGVSPVTARSSCLVRGVRPQRFEEFLMESPASRRLILLALVLIGFALSAFIHAQDA